MKNHLVLLLVLAGLLAACKEPAALSPAGSLPPATGELRVLSYNVLVGFEASEAKKTTFVNWARGLEPDIIVYQELNRFTEATLRQLAARVGHPHAVLLKETGYPVGISSRFPITEVRRVVAGMVHGYLSARVGNYHVFALHLSPSKVEERIAEINLILTAAAGLPPTARVLLAGDFNSYARFDRQAYGAAFDADMRPRNPNTPVDFTVTDAMLGQGYRDAYPLFHSAYKRSVPTARYLAAGDKGCRYDYLFLSPALAADCLGADILQDDVTHQLSDHYPVLARFKTSE